MSNLNKIIEIKSIQFESNEPEVLVKGSITQGNMSYPTDILISQTQLNMIVNKLNNINSDFSFSDTLTIESMYDNEKMFTSDIPNSIKSTFYLNELLAPNSYTQIRA